jgi:hypothetical protein
MVEPKHAVQQQRRCDVVGCKQDAERSVSGRKVEKAGMKLSSSPEKNAHLCREHYKQFKKKTKTDRTYERLGW